MAARLSHVDDRGQARMVDVSAKPETHRRAVAEGAIRLQPATLELVNAQAMPKGDVLSVARVAGVLAAKQTAALIPLCHPLQLTDVQVDIRVEADGLSIRASVSTVGRTGAEMEALTAVAMAALTVYDMCKAVDKGMVVEGIRLIEKHGGRSRARSAAGTGTEAP